MWRAGGALCMLPYYLLPQLLLPQLLLPQLLLLLLIYLYVPLCPTPCILLLAQMLHYIVFPGWILCLLPPHPTPSSQPVLPRVSGDAKPHFAQNTAPVVPYCVCRQKTRGKSTWGDLTSPAPPHTALASLSSVSQPGPK